LWIALALVVLAAGLLVAVALHRRGRELAALCAVGLTAAAITPQGWIHHWVWFAPALLILAAGARRSIAAWCGVVVLFYAVNGRFYFLTGGDPWSRDGLHLGLGEQLMAASSLLAAAALLVFTVPWLRRDDARLVGSAESPAAAERSPVREESSATKA
jgi:hypothetical protein